MSKEILEAVVANVDDAVSAEKGGASRLEIVSEPEREELTPSIEIIKRIQDTVNIPIRVMVRDKNSFTGFNSSELERMAEFVNQLSESNVQGIVVGFLTKDGKIDIGSLEKILEKRNNLGVTFHRAIDKAKDIDDSIKMLIESKLVDRILTSCGAETSVKGIKTLREINTFTTNGLKIIAGGAISADNIKAIRQNTGIMEFHVGRSVRENKCYGENINPWEVQRIADVLNTKLI